MTPILLNPRILLTGGVGTGKTTLAKELSALTGAPIFPTDDALWLPKVVSAVNPWIAANDVVAEWMHRSGPWIIEGVRVPHALAHYIRTAGRDAPFPFTPPLIYLTLALHYETREQAAMTASALAATSHCENRLAVPTIRTAYHPTLAAELAATL